MTERTTDQTDQADQAVEPGEPESEPAAGAGEGTEDASRFEAVVNAIRRHGVVMRGTIGHMMRALHNEYSSIEVANHNSVAMATLLSFAEDNLLRCGFTASDVRLLRIAAVAATDVALPLIIIQAVDELPWPEDPVDPPGPADKPADDDSVDPRPDADADADADGGDLDEGASATEAGYADE